MLKRIITGAIIFLFVAGAVASRFIEPMVFDLFVFLLMFFATIETAKCFDEMKKKYFASVIYSFPIIIWACYFFAQTIFASILYQLLALVVAFCVSFAIEIIEPRTQKGKEAVAKNPELIEPQNILNKTLTTLAILVYPNLLLGTLFGINAFGVNLGFIGLLLALGVAMLTDTFAYFFGVMLKGKRLCPHISPKKGVPGMIFGAIGGVVVSALAFVFFRVLGWFNTEIVTMKLSACIAMFAIIGVVGTFASQFGDLLASGLKRKAGIKDFGNLFPGHGGIMDRVDGMMFTSLITFICFLIFI